MKISKIYFEMIPYYLPHNIELHCKMVVDGEVINWREAFPDSDFESRAERYFDYMKHKIIDAMKKEDK